jgi:plastocyanin
MNRRLRIAALAGFMATALWSVSTDIVGAAGGVIQGTITATGLGSNADAVVYVQQVPGKFPAPVKPANMDQRSMQFTPHVLPIMVGTTVQFLNSDPTAHNVFSPDHEKFNLGTWPQGQTKDRVFSTCPKAPCAYVLLCRVHPEMEGYVVVLQNPFFAVTGADGRYKIENVPAGNYTVGVWHPKLKSAPKPATVDAAKPAAVDFTLNK